MDLDEFSGERTIRDPDLVHYACIAKGTTVLAEFNCKDAALGEIAVKCLEKTPPYHATFAHTVRSRTYTFFIEEPFVYFAIFDENVKKSEGLAFLKSVGSALAAVVKGKDLESLGSHCFQGEFNPVFRQLLGFGIGSLGSPIGERFDLSEDLQCGSSTSIVGNSNLDGDRSSRKMKNRLLGEFNSGRKILEKKASDEFSMVGHKKGGFYPGEMVGHQKAKKIWKKQVWIILSLDLFICLILFVIWLWICSGFKCMDS